MNTTSKSRKSTEQVTAEADFPKATIQRLRKLGLAVKNIAGQGSGTFFLYTLCDKDGEEFVRSWPEVVDISNGKRPLVLLTSIGHIGFAYGFEYFWAANGDLYRANVNNPLDTEGYRMGARFESTPHSADYFLTQAGLR